jgi:septum formation protein
LLASTSPIRQAILRNAGIPFDATAPKVDEVSVTEALLAEGLRPRDVADALAELKALRGAPAGLVLGCAQTLSLDDRLVAKAGTPEAAEDILASLSGRSHRLHTAAVLVEDGRPVWRHVADATLTMRPLSAAYIRDYVARNWEDVRRCSGCYMVEGEGGRLFHTIRGDHFAVLGLPLFPLVDFLVTRGELAA